MTDESVKTLSKEYETKISVLNLRVTIINKQIDDYNEFKKLSVINNKLHNIELRLEQ